MAEFAAVSVRRSAVYTLAQDNKNNMSAIAAKILPYIEESRLLDRYVAAAQIGITLSSIILGAYTQAVLVEPITVHIVGLGIVSDTAALSAAAIIILAVFTVLQMIFGELLPKSLALQYPIHSAIYTFYPMRFSMFVFSWYITILNGSGNGILKLFKVSLHNNARAACSVDELDVILTESHKEGFLEDEEHERLKEALNLTERTAREIMIPRRKMTSINLEDNHDDIWQTIIDTPYTRIPVYTENIDEISGIMSTRDALLDYIKTGDKKEVQHFISPAVFVPETISATNLLTTMREKKRHIAIVLDEFGGTEGLVTLEDVLAEIFGDMGDEFKEAENREAQILKDGRIILPGDYLLADLKKYIDTTFSETDEVDTINGLLSHETGQIAEVGQKIALEKAEIEVTEIKNNTAYTVILTLKNDEVSEND